MSELSSGKTGSNTALAEISIRGLGVIESANIEFSKGLTVLTGETGAGKTMVLTALGLVLGAKADSDLVRTGSERTLVSARFEIDPATAEVVLDGGGDTENGELLLTRTVTAEGKSRINVGGALSTSAKVTELAELLIEIHGQSTNLRLAKPSVQREMLDLYVGAQVELSKYLGLYEAHKTLESRIAILREQSAKTDEEIAELNSFMNDFSQLMPTEGELTSIESEIVRLGSVEEFHTTISSALNIIEDEERGTLSSLQSARKVLDAIREKDPALDKQIEKYATVIFDLTDVVSDLLTYLSQLEADPARFDALQKRKAGINALIKKWGQGSDRNLAYSALITRYAEAEESLKDLVGGDTRILELENELEKLFGEVKIAAASLSAKRRAGAQTLASAATGEMQKLSMPNAQLICEVKTNSGDNFRESSPSGLDEIALLFAGHAGANPLPLSKVASGGETSRVMLALSVVIAQSSPIGTYIFDEVDAGVGGAAAVEVGRRLAALAKSSQVIVVTHLAQVAVWADNHLVVRKDESGSVSASDVIALDEAARKVEIARMLSGQAQSESAQEHALELLELVRKSSLNS